MKKTASRRSFYAFFCLRARDGCFAAPAASRCCACGRKLVLRLRARDGAFRAPARVPFFFCKKKGTKENHLDLRSKGPLARGGFRRCGGESIFPWRGGGLRRPHFFLRRKKCGKESRLDLRSKGPLARYGLCKIGGAGFAELVRRSSLSVKRTVPAFTGAEASATACPSHGRGICFYRVGDYQIAPLAPCGGKGRCARWAQDIIIS